MMIGSVSGFAAHQAPCSVLVDESGIYFVSAKNEFVNGGSKNSIARRETFRRESIREMRDAIKIRLNS